MAEFKGGCLCGAVRYASTAEPAFMANCHCDDCRKSSAAGHMSLIGLPKDQVEFSGAMSEYQVTADSGASISHHFCPSCGSQVYTASSSTPVNAHIVAATLDDLSAFSPQAVVFASKAAPWDRPFEGVPHFDKMPPIG